MNSNANRNSESNALNKESGLNPDTHLNRTHAQVNKSPSDTTIYRPALMKGVNESNDIINKISDFVEGIRIGGSRQDTPGDKHYGTPRMDAGKSDSMKSWDEPQPSTLQNVSKDTADHILIDAEQYKAKLQPPKGKAADLPIPMIPADTFVDC